MTETVKIISPIDGSVYAERPLATAEELFGAGSAEHDAVRKAWDTVKVRV